MSKYRATPLYRKWYWINSQRFSYLCTIRHATFIRDFGCCWYFWQMNMIYYWQFVIRRRFSRLALWPHRSCVLFCLLNWDKTLSFHMEKNTAHCVYRVRYAICDMHSQWIWMMEMVKWSSHHWIGCTCEKENAHNKDRIKSSRFSLECRA